ncbi:hypothetical protein PMALA_031630 [Plasmodium malariae]|uniref:Uncharacterized protein n=1 Tax=Plasmodium malariae TaxID=5858 RepID=A0A1A8WG21_PLAMA|nr:hypothetical protein PMALA_031630 [Plasmodium malariae]
MNEDIIYDFQLWTLINCTFKDNKIIEKYEHIKLYYDCGKIVLKHMGAIFENRVCFRWKNRNGGKSLHIVSAKHGEN